MVLFKGCNASVKVLRDDAFYVLVSLQKYMKSKLKDKDHVFYDNYKGTNQDYWGESYTYLEKIVLLFPNYLRKFQRKTIPQKNFFYKPKNPLFFQNTIQKSPNFN